MNTSEITMFISSLAVMISNEIPDNDELALWGSSITRLGNTLTAISAQRSLIKKKESKASKDNKITSKPASPSLTTPNPAADPEQKNFGSGALNY